MNDSDKRPTALYLECCAEHSTWGDGIYATVTGRIAYVVQQWDTFEFPDSYDPTCDIRFVAQVGTSDSTITADLDAGGIFSRFDGELKFAPGFAMELRADRLEQVAKELRRVEKRLAAIREQYGPPNVGGWFQRIASIYRCLNVVRHDPHTRGQHHWLLAASANGMAERLVYDALLPHRPADVTVVAA